MGIQDWFRRKVEDFTSGYWDMEMKSMVKPMENKPQSFEKPVDFGEFTGFFVHSVGISWFNGAFFSVHYIPPSPMVWQYHKPTMTDLGCCRSPVGLAVWNMAGLWLSIQFGMSSSQMTNSIIFQRGRYTTSHASNCCSRIVSDSIFVAWNPICARPEVCGIGNVQFFLFPLKFNMQGQTPCAVSKSAFCANRNFFSLAQNPMFYTCLVFSQAYLLIIKQCAMQKNHHVSSVNHPLMRYW